VKSGECALTRGEYQKLLSVADSLEDDLMLHMAIETGLRREDLVSIRYQDISFPDASLTFLEKKKKRVRSIPISRGLVQLLQKHRKTHAPRERVFDFSGRTAWNRLHRLCVLAKIPPRPFHALRATCVKFCQASGWTPSQVGKLTGDSLRVIEEHYACPSEAEMREAVEKRQV
jgi:integrase